MIRSLATGVPRYDIEPLQMITLQDCLKRDTPDCSTPQTVRVPSKARGHRRQAVENYLITARHMMLGIVSVISALKLLPLEGGGWLTPQWARALPNAGAISMFFGQPKTAAASTMADSPAIWQSPSCNKHRNKLYAHPRRYRVPSAPIGMAPWHSSIMMIS
ncbi:MAG: hypothetical protein FRX49_08440 [Trebouxia sp. A1-2]|nr:MAG: hypothetical protein FRX49_08440 [Trebouxia sp. A1-2]